MSSTTEGAFAVQQRIQKLYNDPSHADFTIQSKGGKEFKVHKAIISACEPIANMLKHDFKETATGVMKLEDSTFAVEHLIKHLYGFKYTMSTCGKDQPTIQDTLDVYAIADMRMLPGLKDEVKTELAHYLSQMECDTGRAQTVFGNLAAFCDLINKVYSNELYLDGEMQKVFVDSVRKYCEGRDNPEKKKKMMHVIKQCPDFAFDLVRAGMIARAFVERDRATRAQDSSGAILCAGEHCGKRYERKLCVSTTRGRYFCIDCIRKHSLPREWFIKPELK